MGSTFEEHLEYISDPIRTDLFRRAIAETVRPGDVVVDLGCGFGLLGILCLQAGAEKVWGIDQTDAIEIARDVAERAGVGNRYHCLRGRSFDVSLPGQADVIICDHVGFFGFDYGIIELLADARRRFLRPGGTVIPQALDLVVGGVASKRCQDRAHAWSSPDIPPDFRWLSEYGVNSKYSERFEEIEITTTDEIVATVSLLAENDGMLSGKCELQALRDADLSGLGGWFDAWLTSNVSMTNSPRDPRSIRRNQLFLPFKQPLRARGDDILDVEIKASHDTNILSWSAHNKRTGEKRFQTTWRSRILPKQAGEPAQ